jgi:hypothetical protein
LKKKKVDFNTQRATLQTGETIFEYPEVLPITGPDEDLINERLEKK